MKLRRFIASPWAHDKVFLVSNYTREALGEFWQTVGQSHVAVGLETDIY